VCGDISTFWKIYTIPAHFGHYIFPKNHDFLSAVLNSKKNKERKLFSSHGSAFKQIRIKWNKQTIFLRINFLVKFVVLNFQKALIHGKDHNSFHAAPFLKVN